MKYVLLKSKPDKLRFAILATGIAFVLGIIGYTIPIAANHYCFFVSAPLATFLPAYFAWQLTFSITKYPML